MAEISITKRQHDAVITVTGTGAVTVTLNDLRTTDQVARGDTVTKSEITAAGWGCGASTGTVVKNSKVVVAAPGSGQLMFNRDFGTSVGIEGGSDYVIDAAGGTIVLRVSKNVVLA